MRVITEWPDTALLNIGLDRYTAIACLTHEPRIDDIALSMALRADCGYIGALGSAKSHSKRVERLENMGFSADDIERIHAPIGLDIGAASPAEIAVSILAEIVLSWRAKPLRSENPESIFRQTRLRLLNNEPFIRPADLDFVQFSRFDDPHASRSLSEVLSVD